MLFFIQTELISKVVIWGVCGEAAAHTPKLLIFEMASRNLTVCSTWEYW